LARLTDRSFLIASNGLYLGLVTRDGIEQALRSGNGSASVTSLLIQSPSHAHVDHSLEFVLKRLAKIQGYFPSSAAPMNVELKV
jgi:hypothetical protein